MKTLLRFSSALALVFATQSFAEITQDCILKGTVNQTRAAFGTEEVHLVFRSAARGKEGPCRMSRVDRSRRVQFTVPGDNDIVTAPPGSTVKYRYTEDVEGNSQWRLLHHSNETRL